MTVGDPHLATLFRGGLVALCKKAEDERPQRSQSQNLGRCFAALRSDPRLRPIPHRTLEEHVRAHPEQIDTSTIGGLVPLPVPTKGRFVPMVNVFYDFSAIPATMRLQVASFTAVDGTLKAHGFRFETPEPASNHRFFHAQPLLSIHRTSKLPSIQLPGIGHPLSNRDPTFPLDANHFIELFFCMLIALYGRDDAWSHSSVLGDPLGRERMRKLRVYTH